MIGRESLCDELHRIVANTISGRGELVLLAGEASVGKTRLVTDVLGGHDVIVLGVTASPATLSPFGPLVAALRAFLRVVPDGLPG